MYKELTELLRCPRQRKHWITESVWLYKVERDVTALERWQQPQIFRNCWPFDIWGCITQCSEKLGLGGFEYLVLSSAARLGDDAYGAAVRKDIELSTRRCCSLGALYTTLDRLEAKGLIDTWLGDPTPRRGGKPKRVVRITGKRRRAAKNCYISLLRASRGLPWTSELNEVRS
jgi:PadR family transcriptional regulator PadR